MSKPKPVAVSEGLEELCKVCQRVQFGEIQRLAFGKWRHSYCYPGSQEWCEYFKALSPSEQTAEGRILFECKSKLSIAVNHPIPEEV